MRPLNLLFTSICLLGALPAGAAPEITVEIGGESRPSGSAIQLASEPRFDVTDPVQFDAPEGPVVVSFANVSPGEYTGQISNDGEIWTPATPLLLHPSAGTLSFTHDPGPVVTAFYRLFRVIDSCVEVTVRNTGDMPLTGIAASLGGADSADFTLDLTATAASLAAGGSTTMIVCFTAADLAAHSANLAIASNDADENPFVLSLVGDNDPGPIQSLPSYSLVGVTWDHPGAERLCLVDTATGAATPFSATRTRNILGIAWDDASRKLYATTSHLSSPASRLVEIDPLTGATIADHSIGLGGLAVVAEGDVAVQPSTGLVFCLISGGIVQVWNPATATLAYSFQLPMPALFNDYSALAFNAAGDLFTIDPNSFTDDPTGIAELHRIDPLDGTILSTVPLSADLGVVMGLAFHPETDEAFVADSCDAEPAVGPDTCNGFHLYRLDVTTGQLTSVGATGSGFGLCGLTFMPEITPSSPAPEVRVVGPVGEIASGQPGVFQFDVNAFGGGTGHSFLIHNDGNLEPLILTGVTLPSGFTSSLSGFPRSIEPGQPLTLTISSVGPAQGVYEGDVVLATNDADEATFAFPIRALFNMPEIVVGSGFFGSNELVDGGALDLGETRLGESRRFQLRVRNLHAGPLSVSGITLPAGYQLAAPVPAFPFSLGKDQARDISFVIVSSVPGNFSGTLSIHNNDFDEGPFDIQLTGTVSPESMLFFGFSTSIAEGGSVSAAAFGSGPVSYAWDLDGDGQFDDAIGDTLALPDSDGPATFLASVRMTDNLSSMVRTAAIPINNVPPSVNATLPESVLAGTNLTMDVSANDIPADRAAGMTWQIDWGDGNSSSTPAGHASETLFSHTFAQPGQASITVEATDKDGSTGTTFGSVWVHSAVIGVFDGADTGGQELRDGQDSLSFSTFAGGTQDRALTVLNRSGGAASFGPLALPVGFSLVSPPVFPAPLAPGASLTLTLRFAPTAGGSYDGTLAMATSDPALASFEIFLSAFADAPDIEVSEFSGERFDFASGEQSFSIFPGTGAFVGTSFHIASSNSAAPLVITGIDLPAAFQFEVAPSFPIDFSSSSSIDLRLQCSGASPGFYKGWVSIHSNDPDEEPFRFFVNSRVGDVADLLVKSDASDLSSGTGIVLSGQAQPLVFPDRLPGEPSPAMSLRLHNQGSMTMTVSAISLPAGFGFASPPALPITLTAFSSATLPDLRVTATAAGSYNGDVSITSTDPDENPYHFPVRATIPPPSVTGLVITPGGGGNAVAIRGTITGGQPDGVAVIEASVDLGLTDPWRTIATIPLDSSGSASFGNPTPLEDPLSNNSKRWFLRVR